MTGLRVFELALPFVAVQLYLFGLFYLSISRKRYRAEHKYLMGFLASMIFFLLCYIVDEFTAKSLTLSLIQLRLAVLIAVAFPSLTIASYKICGKAPSRRFITLLYSGGICAGALHSGFLDLGWKLHFRAETGTFLGISAAHIDGFAWAKSIASLATLSLALLPCSFLLSSLKRLDLKSRAFVISSMLFAILFLIGVLAKQWWIYYLGSIITALIFLSAIYLDLHYLNQTAAFIKEELKHQILSGQEQAHGQVSKLVENLETSSHGDLALYKLHIREVFNMITDEASKSGGDLTELIAKSEENLSKIAQATDIETLTKVTESEAQELSELIINIPHQKRLEVVQSVKAFVLSNLDQPLTLFELAEQFCVSKSYLTNGFKELEGITLNQFITQARIERAKEMLKTHSVTETAYEVGFNNSNYFSTVFKKVTGQTPKAYREKIGQD